jgi:hypothetical protein
VAFGALLLAFGAFVCTVFGVLLTPVPVVGAVFAFGAPVLAIAGIVVGGKAVTASKQRGGGERLALAGVIVSAIALVPALITALTCGTCNALCATGGVKHNVYSFGKPPASLRALLQPPLGAGDAGLDIPISPLGDDPSQPGGPAQADAGAAEPSLPPPPLSPGPSR